MVGQASAFWQQILHQISNWSLPEIRIGSQKQRNFQQHSSEPGKMLGLLTIFVAMLLWNWKLLLALIVGISMMLLAYSLPEWNWQGHWDKIYKFFHGANRRLALAVGSGGIATLTSYIAATIWVDSHNPWLATGMIVQILCMLLTLALLMWQILSLYGSREEDHVEKLLINLTQKDPLQRLIAVRQLTKLISHKSIDTIIQKDIIQCLKFRLNQEEEIFIKEAICQSLLLLDAGHIAGVRRNKGEIKKKLEDRIVEIYSDS